MTTFKVCGRGSERVDRARRVLGRACFLSGLDTADFIVRSQDPNDYNIAYVKADKMLESKSVEACDFLILLDSKVPAKAFEGLKDGSVIFVNAAEKVAARNVRTKCYAMPSARNEDMVLLGGLTKVFPKVSIKSMKSAIEEELGDDKPLQNAFDEGYRGVK